MYAIMATILFQPSTLGCIIKTNKQTNKQTNKPFSKFSTREYKYPSYLKALTNPYNPLGTECRALPCLATKTLAMASGMLVPAARKVIPITLSGISNVNPINVTCRNNVNVNVNHLFYVKHIRCCV